MQDQNFEELLNESMKKISVGEVLDGTVISVNPMYVALNIGYKADGIVKREDFSDDSTLDLTTVCKPGDKLKVKVKKLNDGEGQVALSRKELIRAEINDKLEKAYKEGGVHRGKVVKTNAGGLSIELEPGVLVFMPASLVSVNLEKDLEKYVGQELDFVITEFNPAKRRIIADRKKLMLEELKLKKAEALAKIHEGDIIDGTIKSLLDFGAFVDLGGVDGLLHVSEIGWGRIQNPKKVFNIGEKVRVLVKELKDGKISLTAKFPDENPWLLAKANYAIGNVIKGKVARMTDYGAFIQLDDYIDALLHVSQISRDRIKTPSDVLKIGDEVEVKVIEFDADNKRISVSIKALLPEPEKVVKEEKPEESEVQDVDIEAYAKKMEEEENK